MEIIIKVHFNMEKKMVMETITIRTETLIMDSFIEIENKEMGK
jgi:hypothetical protein